MLPKCNYFVLPFATSTRVLITTKFHAIMNNSLRQFLLPSSRFKETAAVAAEGLLEGIVVV